MKGRLVQTAVAIDWNVLARSTVKQEVITIQIIRAVNNEALNHQLGFNDFQSVLHSLRTRMFKNIMNGSFDGMQIDVIR